MVETLLHYRKILYKRKPQLKEQWEKTAEEALSEITTTEDEREEELEHRFYAGPTPSNFPPEYELIFVHQNYELFPSND